MGSRTALLGSIFPSALDILLGQRHQALPFSTGDEYATLHKPAKSKGKSKATVLDHTRMKQENKVLKKRLASAYDDQKALEAENTLLKAEVASLRTQVDVMRINRGLKVFENTK